MKSGMIARLIDFCLDNRWLIMLLLVFFIGVGIWVTQHIPIDAFPDLKVQVVDAFPDLKVQVVDAFPDKCGKWTMVDAFPDVKIQMVTAFPDLKIKYVNAFPGLP